MTALFVPSATRDTGITGCGPVCQTVVAIQVKVRSLFYVNLIDMILEIFGLIFVVVSAYKFFRQPKNDSSSKYVHRIMWLFALFDFVLQIIALSITVNVKDSMRLFQEANCLDVTTVEGLKKHDILKALTSSVIFTLLFGIIEIMLTCTEMGCSYGGRKVCPSRQDKVVIMMINFQTLETLMTTTSTMTINNSQGMPSVGCIPQSHMQSLVGYTSRLLTCKYCIVRDVNDNNDNQ